MIGQTKQRAIGVAKEMNAPRRAQAVPPEELETWINTSRRTNIPLLDRPTVMVVPPSELQTSKSWESIHQAVKAMPYPLILLETRDLISDHARQSRQKPTP